KAADAARAESRESQKIEQDVLRDQQNLLKDQLDAVLKVNDGLRVDLVRVKQKQDGIRDTVKESISVGLQEIREQLYEISVKEIVDHVPHKFREDLEAELSAAAERIMNDLISKLRDSPGELVDADAITAVAEKAVRVALAQWPNPFQELDYRLRELRNI